MFKKLSEMRELIGSDETASNHVTHVMQEGAYLLNGFMGSYPKLAKAVAIGSVAVSVAKMARTVYSLYRSTEVPDVYSIRISEDDSIFEVVEGWFMDSIPVEQQTSINAHSSVVRSGEDPPSSRKKRRKVSQAMNELDYDLMHGTGIASDDNRVVVDYSFDGTFAKQIEVAGHQVEIFMKIPEKVASIAGAEVRSLGGSKDIYIVCQTPEARNDVLAEIEEQSQFLVESQPKLFVSSRWGDFRKRDAVARRSRDSVILKEGQMDRILDYLKEFSKNKAAYMKADIPFRTGILLYGEPGSGKSSTALAIANELKMNVFVISLTSLTSDEALGECFAGIPPNSIIVLEDIDIVSAVKDRDGDDNESVTMTGMLNVLDGFQSPPGVITIMTTNRLDVLDPAIIRPGRVDLMEELGCLDSYQLRGMCEYFIGHVPEGLPEITPADGITSAEIMGVIRKHIPSFEGAGEDVVRFVETKLLESMVS